MTGTAHAIVTGAAHGIGLATARVLAEQGMVIHCADIDEAGCASCVDGIRERGGAAVAHTVDLGAGDGPSVMVEAVVRVAGASIGVLVNNAFRYEPGRSLLEVTSSDWESELGLLFQSYVDVIRAADSYLGPGSSIVNLASVRGTFGGGGFGSYSVAKAAVAQLTRALAIELGPRGVRVNAVAPGIIATARTLAADPRVLGRYEAITPLRRLGQPEDVATAIGFLTSDTAGFITGQVLTIDGGLTLPLQLDSANLAVEFERTL